MSRKDWLHALRTPNATLRRASWSDFLVAAAIGNDCTFHDDLKWNRDIPMGHHYVPQRYLKNFEIPSQPGIIWLFEKANGGSKAIPIKAVAQEPAFYEDEDEAKLNEAVESPANAVIDKLLRRQSLSQAERTALARYMAVMVKRVPYSRHKALELMPQALESAVSEVKGEWTCMIGRPEYDQARLKANLSELDGIHQKYQTTPPPRVVRQIRDPWPTSQMIELIQQMTWRVLESSGPDFYITSDNPAFFFRGYGLKNRDTELCFPLSWRHVLHCCWQVSPGFAGISYLDATQRFVREMNRRQASTTLRFAFCHERAAWLPKTLSKASPYLSRVVW